MERCDAFHGIDMQQVWAEVKTLWEAGEQWWLTDEEERLRAGDADEYRVIGEAEELANQWFEDHDYSSRQTMNVTDFCRKKLQITPSRENVAMVKSVLLARCGKMRRQLDGIKNGWPIPVGYVKSNNLQGGKLALGAKMRNLQGHSDG